MSTIKRFCCYWWESTTKSKEAFDKITWGITALSWVAVVVIEWGGVSVPKDWQILTEPFLEKTVWAIAIMLALRAIFWLPFRKHEAQASAHEKEKKELLKVVDSLSNKEELEHTKAAMRKVVKDTLGLYLECIGHQIIHVEIIDWFTITDEVAEKEIFAWSDMKIEIFDFLKRNFSGAEAAYFGSDSGLHQTPADDNDKLLPDRKRQRQFLLDQMAHHSKQLKAIIEKLI